MHTNIKKKGFTLAEILISLLILGVIASLTIPSLIQNTHKKEEVVKVKKGLSMLNQAISMNYALTEDKLSKYDTEEKLLDMLKKRLSIVDSSDDGTVVIITQDGLKFKFYRGCYDPTNELTAAGLLGNGCLWDGYIYTKAEPSTAEGFSDIAPHEQSTQGNLSGAYWFYCLEDRCVPYNDTAKIMNSTDPTKAE